MRPRLPSLGFIVALIVMGYALTIARAGTVTAHNAAPPASFSINLLTPAANSISDDDLAIAVTVTSTVQLNTVKAKVDNREVSLAFSSTAFCNGSTCTAGWAGTLSLAGLTRGTKTLLITATDVFGGFDSIAPAVIYDKMPVLTVVSPIPESVTGRTLRVKATCVDDDPTGCKSISVSYQHPSFGPGTSGTIGSVDQTSIDQDVTLPATIRDFATDGNMLYLNVRATDSAGQTRVVSRIIYVQHHHRMIELESFVGRILDVQGDRVLLLNNPGTVDNTLTIRARSTGDESVIPLAGRVVTAGFLSAKGAVFSATDSNTVAPAGRAYEWRDAALLDLGELFIDVRVAGDYALWDTFDRNLSTPVLLVRNLLTGVTSQVATGTNAGGGADIAATGDVVYVRSSGRNAQGQDLYNIYRVRNGATVQLTNDAVDFNNSSPVTDGINVEYQRQPRSPQPTDYVQTAIDFNGGFFDLATQANALGRGEYRVAGGWIAFPKLGGGVPQIWTRSPAGDLKQITFFGTTSLANQLSSTGDVVLSNSGRTYLQRNNGDPLFDFAAAAWPLKTFTVGDQWYAFLGRTLYRLPTAADIAPVLLTDPDTGRVLALSSPSHMRDPLPFASDMNFSSDQRTRVLLFARNIDWLSVNPNTPVTVLAEDAAHHVVTLTVEYAAVNPSLNWLTEIVVKLPDEARNGGELTLTLNVGGFLSNKAKVVIVQAPQ